MNLTPGMWVLINKDPFQRAICHNETSPLSFIGGRFHGHYSHPQTLLFSTSDDLPG